MGKKARYFETGLGFEGALNAVSHEVSVTDDQHISAMQCQGRRCTEPARAGANNDNIRGPLHAILFPSMRQLNHGTNNFKAYAAICSAMHYVSHVGTIRFVNPTFPRWPLG